MAAAALPVLGNSLLYKLLDEKQQGMVRKVQVAGCVWYEPCKPYNEYTAEQQLLLPRAHPAPPSSANGVLVWNITVPPWLASKLRELLKAGNGDLDLGFGLRASGSLGSASIKHVSISGALPHVSDADLLGVLVKQKTAGALQFDTLHVTTDMEPLPGGDSPMQAGLRRSALLSVPMGASVPW